RPGARPPCSSRSARPGSRPPRRSPGRRRWARRPSPRRRSSPPRWPPAPRLNRPTFPPPHSRSSKTQMAEFTAKDVQRLRQMTGAGMLDSKKALEDSDGDFEAAAKLLREKGLGSAAKRSDRENTQGAVAIARAGDSAGMVELKSETDFVAKSPDFVNLANEL